MPKPRARRAHVTKIRLSDAERQHLTSLAADAGLTLADFLRLSATQSVVVNRSDWRKRTFQLGKIGNNLNQLSRWANTHKTAVEASTVVLALLRIERLLRSEFGLDLTPTDAGGATC
ncbi:MAG: MobC family plasmid mobilization relaxosome protein [Pigmentiphaga sp.]